MNSINIFNLGKSSHLAKSIVGLIPKVLCFFFLSKLPLAPYEVVISILSKFALSFLFLTYFPDNSNGGKK
jgi:hypothetical protein